MIINQLLGPGGAGDALQSEDRAVDPVRRAVVLCAGDKTEDKRFYKRMIPIAEAEYARFTASL